MIVKALPVLYACAGCRSSASAIAQHVAAALERRGLAEMSCLPGAGAEFAPELSRAKSRFPVFVIDGCRDACARRCLAHYGVTPQRHFVLTGLGVANRPDPDFDPAEADRVAERIAADW